MNAKKLNTSKQTSIYESFNPSEYEQMVAKYFQTKGYDCEERGGSYDKGVDIIAQKNNQKIAIQVKMYNERLVNYQAVMYLFAGQKLFNCQKSILITSGKVNKNARKVAKDLGVDIYENWYPIKIKRKTISQRNSFSQFWIHYVMTLKGITVKTVTGKINTIQDVSFDGISRITSTGKKNFVPIEIFKQVYNLLQRKKQISRKEINHLFPGRASSFIVAVFGKIDGYSTKVKPIRIIYRNSEDCI